jgi:hypothetical protein
MYAFYIASAIFLCAVSLKTPADTQNNITVLTIVSSLPSFVMFAADYRCLAGLDFFSVGGIV